VHALLLDGVQMIFADPKTKDKVHSVTEAHLRRIFPAISGNCLFESTFFYITFLL
jgi:hypothetical protein